VARIKAGEPLTVAGHPSDRTPTPVEAFFYGVVDQLQRRWNVQAVFLEGDSDVDQVASGEAVLAVNAVPRWDGADRVDYAVPLVGHGDRLMIAVQSDIESFHDLAGLTVGVFADEGGAADRVVALGKSVGVNVETRTLGSTDEARTAMISRDVTAVFGDGLRLMGLVGANPDAFRLTDRSYAPRSMTFALKADDADFRALLNFTLQEMAQDGTLERLAAEAGIDSLLDLAVWPGDGSWLGVNMQPPG
jgi:ABC-type amino acid transport substrate-binding protein